MLAEEQSRSTFLYRAAIRFIRPRSQNTLQAFRRFCMGAGQFDHPYQQESMTMLTKNFQRLRSEDEVDLIRAGADWQLEQVLHWLRTIKWPLV